MSETERIRAVLSRFRSDLKRHTGPTAERAEGSGAVRPSLTVDEFERVHDGLMAAGYRLEGESLPPSTQQRHQPPAATSQTLSERLKAKARQHARG